MGGRRYWGRYNIRVRTESGGARGVAKVCVANMPIFCYQNGALSAQLLVVSLMSVCELGPTYDSDVKVSFMVSPGS
jgi:hypothetical protein